MFGLVTQRELRALEEKLEKKLEVMEYEWADWYQKFRTLHARLAKREKDASRIDQDERSDGGPTSDTPPLDLEAKLAGMDPRFAGMWRERLRGGWRP